MNITIQNSITGCKSIIKLLLAAWMAVVIPESYAQDYKSIEITNIEPVEILPIIWQVDIWDRWAYEHIKPLRVAEATRIRDMMWEYGAGNHSAEEYKQLMARLNTGMVSEHPKWYDNYEVIWWWLWGEASDHAHNERDMLNTLINHSNFKVSCPNGKHRSEVVAQYVKANPSSINIFWCSAYTVALSKGEYDKYLNEKNIKDLCNLNNFIIFAAGTNIREYEWHIRNKIYNWEYAADEYWMYSLASLSNSNKNTDPNTHLLVTIATNHDWVIDQTNEYLESSKFPVCFADNVLFSWRAFPYRKTDWKVYAEWSKNNWKYSTSYTNYLNVAIADLCFQMKADVSDVDELLEMIRSTALTDYIRFDLNGDGDTDDTIDGQPESQPLQLMNPAGFFQKYLMPTSLPTNIKSNGTTPLEKGYYHGVVYQIPGAEVNINGQWIPFTDDNKGLIFSQNPMNLEWRLNGTLLNSYGYKSGDTINGQIIAVDDQWNGLNITKDFSVNIVDASGISAIINPDAPATWYTVDGIRLDAEPSQSGVYIKNGQKVIIR